MRGRVILMHAPPDRQLLQHLKLSAGQTMARFVPDSVVLDLPSPGEQSRVAVPLPAYADASSDTLAGWESVWIAHLDAAHGASLRQLAYQQMPLSDEDSVRGLQADSDGLTVRIYQADSQRDVRLDFPAPARCGCQAVTAFKTLVTRVTQA